MRGRCEVGACCCTSDEIAKVLDGLEFVVRCAGMSVNGAYEGLGGFGDSVCVCNGGGW